MAAPMRKPRQARGSAGGKRHLPDRVQRAQRARLADKRVQAGLEDARASQAALEARMAAERAEADRLEAERIERLDFNRQAAAQQRARVAAQKRDHWPLGDARDLIRQGYTVESTITRTGWPREMLDDVRQGEW